MGSTKFWKIVTFFSLALILILLVIFWRASTKNKTPAPTLPTTATASVTITAEKPQESGVHAAADLAFEHPLIQSTQKLFPSSDFQAVRVQSGDSLASLFLRMKLPYSDLMQIIRLPRVKPISNHLKANQIIYFKLDKQQLQALKIQLDLGKDLVIEKSKNHFVEKIVNKPVTTSMIYRSGTVHGSFLRSAENSGINANMAHQLMQIFHNEINFSRDVHARDQFAVAYKESFVNGHPYHTGDIVAAKLIVRHHPHYAFRFDAKNHHTYFDENGHSLKSRFIMPPVNYTHISDAFTYHRLDPVLHVVRPHLGIDYAAHRGTPVHSIGNGTVIFSGRERGYGNAVIIQYGQTYKALYGHLQSPARGIHRGTSVHQGQVIGFVGSTGWATGPHVHFELYVNGKPKNPATLHASAESLPRRYLNGFKRHSKQLIAAMSHEHRA